MFGFGLPELIVLFIMFIVPVLWIIALIDIIKSEFTGSNKIIWLLLVFFIPLLGSILYLAIGKGQKIQTAKFSYTPSTCSCGATIQQNTLFCSQCGSKVG